MRNELLARADRALAEVDGVLREERLAKAVDRLIDSAALGSGYTSVYHPSLHNRDTRMRRRWLWATLGCDAVACGCEYLDPVDDMGLEPDYGLNYDVLKLMREQYSYEQVEHDAWVRRNTVQLALDIGGTDPPKQPAEVKDEPGK